MKNSNSVKNNFWSGVVLGEPASKANSRRLVSFGGKPRFIKSSKALSYSEAFKMQVPVLPELLDEDLFSVRRFITLHADPISMSR